MEKNGCHKKEEEKEYEEKIGVAKGEKPSEVVEEFHSFIPSFLHSDHFYSASSSRLLLRSAPNTSRILCRSFTPKRHRQL